jgi:hypothetical protein
MKREREFKENSFIRGFTPALNPTEKASIQIFTVKVFNILIDMMEVN